MTHALRGLSSSSVLGINQRVLGRMKRSCAPLALDGAHDVETLNDATEHHVLAVKDCRR